MGRDLPFVLSLAKFIASSNRFPGSPHHLEVRKFLKKALSGFGEVGTQTFDAVLLKPKRGKVGQDLNTFEGMPYTNSPSGKVWGELVDVGYGLPSENRSGVFRGKVVLVREGKLPFRVKERFFARRGARGIVVYKEGVDEIYAGISAGMLPVVAIRPSDARLLHSGKVVSLEVETERRSVKGENIWVDIGSGRQTLHLIAHYDTKPNTPGAVDNGLSVALLVWLAGQLFRLRRDYGYKIRLLFTDLEEYGLLGAEYFAGSLSETELENSIAVSVDTVGWHNPAILTRDGEGANSPSLLRLCAEMLRDLHMENHFSFTEGRSGRSDHIPFRKRGVRTLFFASNPFPYRHTPLDSFESIDPPSVKNWMLFLSYFAKNVRWD